MAVFSLRAFAAFQPIPKQNGPSVPCLENMANGASNLTAFVLVSERTFGVVPQQWAVFLLASHLSNPEKGWHPQKVTHAWPKLATLSAAQTHTVLVIFFCALCQVGAVGLWPTTAAAHGPRAARLAFAH